jgi:hypothetical protein
VWAAAVVWLVASSAFAQSGATPGVPVAVLPFDGPGATGARSAVAAVLGDDARVEVLDLARTDEAATREGASADGEAGIEAVAGALEARLVVQGTVTGRGARRTVSLVARDASGRLVAAERARLAPGRRALATAIDSLLDAALPSLPAAATPHEEAPRETTHPEPSVTPASPSAPATASTTDAFGEDPALLTLTIAPALRSREASITLDDATTRGYAASPYFELGGAIELRPLAHEHSYARGVFARAEAGGALALASRRADGTSVTTTFYRLSLALGYLVPIERVLELGAGIGGGWDAFQLAANQTMPTVEYPYLRALVRARVRIFGELLVADVEAGYRGIFGREGLSTAFGAQGDGFGWDVVARIAGTVDLGVCWAVEGGYAQYVHAFAGGGALGNGTRGTDGGYRVAASVGYAFR